MTASHHQVLILGGGFTGSLIALALTRLRPETGFLLVEQASRFGGGLIPPYFLDSVRLRHRELIEPLIVREWSGYYVASPDFSTSLPGQTAYLVPEQLHAEIIEKLPAQRYLLGARVVGVEGDRAILEDGRDLTSGLILDARGRSQAGGNAATWRHVHSRHVSFARRHDLDKPILIDASFPETGWSFLQYFPLDPSSLLIQRVAYSTSRILSLPAPPLEEEEGTLLAEGHVAEAVHDGTRHDQTMDVGDGVPVCALNAASWNPAMSSIVASATRIAVTIAEAPILSRDSVLGRLQALAAGAADSTRTGRLPPLTLTDADAGARLASLSHLWVP